MQFTYTAWIKTNEKNTRDGAQLQPTIERWPYQPRFSILLHGKNTATSGGLDRSLRSVDHQIYPFWDLLRAEHADIRSLIASAASDYIVPLRVGDALAQTALFRFAESLQVDKSRLLYGDEDQLDRRGRRTRPWFKPRWNQEMFLAQDYLSSAVAIETVLAKEACIRRDLTNLDDLLLAGTSMVGDAVVHIPHILCHVGVRSASERIQRVAAVARHVEQLQATAISGPFETAKVLWPLPQDLPLVSIIVPTKDKLHLLSSCIGSVLKRTDYHNFEILIVDNCSVEKETLDYLAQIAQAPYAKVLRYPHTYNFSAINNFAAEHASGSFLCLLNNDTEVIEAGWLSEMMRYAVRPEVGAVGAKLLYDNGTIQHAGVVIGIGGAAGHAHRLLPRYSAGYFSMPHVTQYISAVTAACLVVDRVKFNSVGGLDEKKLAVAFNDVDLCLKLQAAGWRNVYVPHAVLLHHEARSRGDDMSPPNIDRYRAELRTLQQRWGTTTYDDPLHNPNLDRHSETFVPSV